MPTYYYNIVVNEQTVEGTFEHDSLELKRPDVQDILDQTYHKPSILHFHIEGTACECPIYQDDQIEEFIDIPGSNPNGITILTT